MITKTFIFNDEEFKKFEGRIISDFGQRLRVVLKCYTVIELKVDKEKKTFTFQKTHKKRKIRFVDPKPMSGFYETTDIGEGKHQLTISVY